VQIEHENSDVQISPVGQFAAVRQVPGTQPPEMHRWPVPYADAQAPSSVQLVHAFATQILPPLQSAAVWQSPWMHAPLLQT
jgi:hypothetical protein